jgi:secondary thiamine-phosphate synthase enzyme
MQISSKILSFKTKEGPDFIDFTKEVQSFVEESRIANGLINIQTLHTTAPLILNENEPLLLEDFKAHLEKISSKNLNYNHNDFSRRTVNVCEEECVNGHSHCQAIHLSPNLTLNVIGGELQLGQWQRIFLAELDSPRPRKVQIQIIGQ